jgi:PAS domain S-box-containing protein
VTTAVLRATIDSLITLTSDNPVQQANARAIAAALARWDREFVTAALATDPRSAAARAAMLQHREGKTEFDTLRAAMSTFTRVEDDLYRERRQGERRLERIALIAVLLELLLLGATLLWLGRRIVAQTEQLVEQHAALAARNALLAEQRDQLEEQAVELEEQRAELETQTTQLQEQALELEHQIEESRALTEQLEASGEEIEAQRRFLRQVVDTIPHFVFVKDRAGRFTFVNQAVADAYGTSTTHLLGRTDADFNDNAEEVEAFRRADLEVLDTGVAKLLAEERVTDAAGQVRYLQTIKRPLFTNGDRANQILGVSTDITDRRRGEEQLHREREFLRSVLESLTEGIVTCDANGTLTTFNRAFRELYRLPTLNIPPEQWTEHYDVFGADGVSRLEVAEMPLYRALQGEMVREAEIIVAPKGGPRRRVLVSGRPMHDATGMKLGAVLAMHDITERRDLEAQLAQAQKMEAVGRLAGGVAHDFNNLLTVITSYTSLLLAAAPADDDRRGDLAEIASAADRAAALTRQLLAFSRKQVLQPRLISLNDVVTGMEKMLRRLIGEDIELATSLSPELGLVNADPGQLEQVLMNLAVNARDAMPDGGRLVLETTNAQLSAEYGDRHLGAAPGSYVMLAVSDTGVGMTREVVSHLFEPFFTTKEQGKGTGLGLSTVYGIVKQSDGDVWVYSEPGQGTTFKIYLPLRVEDVAEALQVPAAPTRSGSETILLVEDDAALRALTERLLRAGGYAVLVAHDGGKALAAAARYEGPIHLVVSDVVMPGMNGRTLVERLRQIRPEIRVLFMSGYTDDEVMRRGIVDRQAAFLQKPFTPDQLAAKVREVLESAAEPGTRSRKRSA